jgi:hypothetical protein
MVGIISAGLRLKWLMLGRNVNLSTRENNVVI